MQRLGPINFKRLAFGINQETSLQNSATMSRFITHYCCSAISIHRNCCRRLLTMNGTREKMDLSNIESKMGSLSSRWYSTNRTNKRIYAEDKYQFQRNSGPRDKFQHANVKYQFQRNWGPRNKFQHANVSKQKFPIKDNRTFEERYPQRRTGYKRYTARPLVSSEHDLEHGADEVTAADVDEGDVFGTLGQHSFNKNSFEIGSKYDDEPDSDGEDLIRPRGRRNTPYWFALQMKKLCKEGKLKEAIEMLQIRMLKEERVKPIADNYNVLIGACGRAGYTKMAFKLYNDMKKRGIPPMDVTYTALINACAESPWPTTDGIERLRRLHGQLQDKKVRINLITHHALMKAYAKCGDVQMTFKLFYHLLSSRPRVSDESFSFFFFACASDGDNGLTYAIQGWRYLLQKRIKPTIHQYNLLLRIARDCGIGDMEVANRVLLQRGQSQELLALPSPLPIPRRRRSKGLLPDKENDRLDIFPINEIVEDDSDPDSEFYDRDDTGDGDLVAGKHHKFWWEEEFEDLEQRSKDKRSKLNTAGRRPQSSFKVLSDTASSVEAVNSKLTSVQGLSKGNIPVPNLLNASVKDLEHVASLGKIARPQDRIALIGGCDGILEDMKKNNVKPDIRTFGLFSELIAYNTEAENKLMVAMDTAGVKGDLDFYNGLIGARARRHDITGAKEIMTQLNSKGVFPDMKTFGNLAKGCYNVKNGLDLLEDIKAAGKKPNIFIFSSLIGAAKRAKDYGYLVKLLQMMQEYDVKPNEWLLNTLENIASFHKKLDMYEKRNDRKKDVNYFRKHYITWLDNVKMAEQEHPWDRYTPNKYQPPWEKGREDRGE